MEKQELIQVIETMLFASGKPVEIKTLCEILEVDKEEIMDAIDSLRLSLIERNSGIQLLKINDGYQLATLEKFYSYICALLDNRPKPSLSQAALEVLAIVAYNPNITRAEMEKIRGVSSDSAMNRLLEYNLIEETGRMDAPGRPRMYKTTDEFLRMFGYDSTKSMPELPKLKEELDQIKMEELESKEENVLDETNNSEEQEQEKQEDA